MPENRSLHDQFEAWSRSRLGSSFAVEADCGWKDRTSRGFYLAEPKTECPLSAES
jgi:hypothetical protein